MQTNLKYVMYATIVAKQKNNNKKIKIENMIK
jgi:hypothetical protein